MAANFKDILSAMNILKSADPKDIASLTADASLAKAVETLRSEDLKPSEIVEGHWQEGHMHRAATREQINVGPNESASGSGAEKMIKDYSNPAVQMHGIITEPMKLAEYLASVDRAMKGIISSVYALEVGQKGINSTLSKTSSALELVINSLQKAQKAKKGGEDEEDEEDDEEESEVVEINAARGKAFLGKAKKFLALAKAKEAEAADEDDKSSIKAINREIRALKKSAAKLLAKARSCAYAASDVELKKSIRAVISKASLKADVDVVQEEEDDEEDDEESEKAKAAAAAAAKADAEATKGNKSADEKGNQADHADPKNGNQAAASKSADEADLVALKNRVDGALNGISTLSGSVNDMMNLIMNRSKSGGAALTTPPDLVKSVVDSAPLLTTEIEAMEDAGTLSTSDAMAARDILSKAAAVRAGVLDGSIVKARIDKSTLAVQALFNKARNAA